MTNRAVLSGVSGEIEINKKSAPEFYLLYQQSVLLALAEERIITESQYRRCMEELTRRRER